MHGQVAPLQESPRVRYDSSRGAFSKGETMNDGYSPVPPGPPAGYPPQQPPAPPAPPMQAGPPPKRRPATVFIVLAVVAVLVVCCCITAAGILLFRAGGKSGTSSESAEQAAQKPWVETLGQDQKRVAEEFGPPSVFGLTFGVDVIGEVKGATDAYRFEWWDYPELGTRFVFADGTFVSSEAVSDPADDTTEDLLYPAITPGDFAEGMTREAVTKLLGSKPTSEVTFKPELMKGLTALDWGGVVTAVFNDKGLVGIQTRPALEGGAQ